MKLLLLTSLFFSLPITAFAVGDLINKSNWEDKVNWLAKMQDLYVSTLEEII